MWTLSSPFFFFKLLIKCIFGGLVFLNYKSYLGR